MNNEFLKNFEEKIAKCIHIIRIDDDEDWIRYLNINNGVIIGINYKSLDVGLDTPKIICTLSESDIEKLLKTTLAQSKMLEDSFSKIVLL
jgi:hypothetical protein